MAIDHWKLELQTKVQANPVGICTSVKRTPPSYSLRKLSSKVHMLYASQGVHFTLAYL